MRYGIIGCGGIGQLRARALAQMPGNQIVVVNDVDQERAHGLSGSVQCQVVRDWRDLIVREDIDTVIVSTPPSLHAEMTVAALRAGKHVLCEKPMARNVDEANDMISASQASGKFLATGFNYRFYPSIQKAKEWLDEGLIGELDHIRSYAGYTAADHSQAWLHDQNIMGGGALRDNGIHLIDLTAYFLGDVVETTGFASGRVWKFPGIEDNGFALLRSSQGKLATLQASWTEWRGYKFLIDIYGAMGCIRASCFPMQTELFWAHKTGGRLTHKTEKFYKTFVMEHLRSYRWVVEQSFIREFLAFEAAVEGKPSEIATGGDGLKTLEIATTASSTFARG